MGHEICSSINYLSLLAHFQLKIAVNNNLLLCGEEETIIFIIVFYDTVRLSDTDNHMTVEGRR